MNNRYERNRRYYLKNRMASMKSSLLHNVKSMGRLPKLATLQKYEISLQEFLQNYNLYLSQLQISFHKLPEFKQAKITNLMQVT